MALNTFTKIAVIEQLTKRANVDWGSIGQGAAYGGLGGGALGGLGSYLFSKEKDGNKKTKDALTAALTGAGLGAATGAGGVAAYHLLPSAMGGKPGTTNNIWDGASRPTQTALGTKAVADVAPYAAAGVGGVKDYLQNKDISNYTKNLDTDAFEKAFSSKNNFSDIVRQNASAISAPDLAQNAKAMDSHITRLSQGNPLRAASGAISELGKAGITGKELAEVEAFMQEGKPVSTLLEHKLTTSPHLGAMVKDVIIGRNPGMGNTTPGQVSFNALSKEAPATMNPFKYIEEFGRQKILDPDAIGHTAAKWLSHLPNTAKYTLPTMFGSILTNFGVNKYLNSAEPQRMAQMASQVDGNR